jgi:hypothetical protein
MATNSDWTVIFEDKTIIKQNGDSPTSYEINDDDFWNDSKWSNIWAIQYKDDNHDYNDSVEYRDTTPHATWTAANLGNFRDQFVNKWDAVHLAKLQIEWDNDERDESEKGARPTSYSSY